MFSDPDLNAHGVRQVSAPQGGCCFEDFTDGDFNDTCGDVVVLAQHRFRSMEASSFGP